MIDVSGGRGGGGRRGGGGGEGPGEGITIKIMQLMINTLEIQFAPYSNGLSGLNHRSINTWIAAMTDAETEWVPCCMSQARL